MSQRFYAPQLVKGQKEYTLDAFESKHLTRVLRKKEGDSIELGNGRGDLFFGKIFKSDAKACVVHIEKAQSEPETTYTVHLALALLKSNDRFEWCLEKATELGVRSITPLIGAHCEKVKFNKERALRTLQSAFKQSLNAYIPELKPEQSVIDYVGLKRNGVTLIGHCYPESDKIDLFHLGTSSSEYHLMIGPEGDFSQSEVARAQENSIKAFSLGNQRLRTETAAIVAINRILCAQL
ncbi:MAG: RsmE family RNA methyltransferase [Flavobacteriaceae bacterium]